MGSAFLLVILHTFTYPTFQPAYNLFIPAGIQPFHFIPAGIQPLHFIPAGIQPLHFIPAGIQTYHFLQEQFHYSLSEYLVRLNRIG